MIYEDKLNRAKSQSKENKIYLTKLGKQKSEELDLEFAKSHEATFKKIDCLSCANCCKTTSPIFLMTDIKRLAKRLEMTVADFITTYLTMDEEDDFVLTTAPCPFLDNQNKCTVYDDRPSACREYPHTNRKQMHQIMDLTYENSLICPAVSDIVDQLKTKLK
ncbi:MAG: Fe-S-cluster containining protein [Cyclobacteriaceae bacterium]|jgi:Fe-S-cluster containining protein